MTSPVVNVKKNAIVVTKKFYEASNVYNTEEYKVLREMQKDFPNYRVEIKKSPKNVNHNKGLSYGFMEKYIKRAIEKNGDDFVPVMDEFLMLRGKSEEAIEIGAESVSYDEIKAWFLKTFPEISNFYATRDSLVA